MTEFRFRPMRPLVAISAAAVFFSCQACASRPRLPAITDDPALRSEMMGWLETAWPRDFQTVHRAVVTIGEADVPLVGQVVVHNRHALRFVAATDLGLKAFDLHYLENGTSQVLKNASGVPTRLLVAGPLLAVRALYCLPDASCTWRGGLDGEHPTLIAQQVGAVRVYRFDPDNHRLVGVTHSRGDRDTLHWQLTDWRQVPGAVGPIASRLSLDHPGLHYTAQVIVLDFRPNDSPQQPFPVSNHD